MKIGPDKTASLSYLLTRVDDGTEIERVTEDKPAMLNFGKKQLLPKFEENLNGLQSGDAFDFEINAEDAYGPIDQYAIFDIPKDTFEVDGKVDEKMLQIGNRIPMTDNDGNKHLGKIVRVHDEFITMDFNHPLAGKNLRFKGQVLKVMMS